MPKTETKMYFMAAATIDGDSLDLIVEATSPNKAKSLWSEHWSGGEGGPPPLNDHGLRIFQLPDRSGKTRVIDWFDDNGAKLIKQKGKS